MIEDRAKLLGAPAFNKQGSVTDQKALNAALFSIMEERFKGGMEMQSRTLKGMISNVADFVGTTGRLLGEPLFKRMESQLDSLLYTLNRLKADGTIDRWISNVHSFGRTVGDVFSSVTNWFRTYKEDLIAIGAGLGTVAIAIGTVTAATKLWTLATAAWSAVMRMTPLGMTITLIGALVAAVVYLYRNFDTVKQKASELWVSMTNSFKSGYNSIVPYINNLIDLMNKIPGINIGHVDMAKLTPVWAQYTDNWAMGNKAKNNDNWAHGSHATGLNRVPFDGYRAVLHKDERVLTAAQARAKDKGVGGGIKIDNIIINAAPGDDGEALYEKFIDVFHRRAKEALAVLDTSNMAELL